MDPSTASCLSQKQQSGDNGSDGHLANSRNDKDDRGPRYVLCSTAPKPPRRAHGDSPLTPCTGNSYGACPVSTRTEQKQQYLFKGMRGCYLYLFMCVHVCVGGHGG